MNIQNDPSINVNIRTPTSERPNTINTRNTNILNISSNSFFRNNFSNEFISFEISTEIYPLNYEAEEPIERKNDITLDLEWRKAKTTETKFDCSICQQKIKLEEKICTVPDCIHHFHFDCLSEWVKYKNNCPLCRTEIPILEE